ncbi:hypothetical protein [Sphingopyxis sp. 22461]|uniref:hypothetical protein n=1 Tax=Sphingopyxis sp. 22461 TaxID=3453923 RepID=UPI003F85FD81
MTDGFSTPVFARLVDVAPRSAWPHEAHAFTPWLADNLDRLSDAIGIPLELTGREVGVGRYSADILASSPADGAVVLIENQLEPSDHTHLGQIMTYLAGLEAQVMIWLAPAFREEHLSALRWLNQHTDERFSFFAVRLRVVQIADSPLAPLFDVLEKPNAWDRSLQQTARSAAAPIDPIAAAQREGFWSAYAERDPAVESDRRVGATVRWRSVPGTGIVISRFRSKGKVGLFLRGDYGRSGELTLPRIEGVANALETELGIPLGNADYPFTMSRPVNHDDPQEVAAAIEWLVSATARYAAAIATHLQMEPA